MLGIGVDFGTSNSCAALFDGGGTHFVRLESGPESPEVLPTALYLDRRLHAEVGRRAIERYLRENAGRNVVLDKEELGEIVITSAGTDTTRGPASEGGALTSAVRVHALVDRELPGRLFRGLKRWLGSASLDRVRVFDAHYRIVALVTPILQHLARAAEREARDSARSAYVGRPVRFEGRSPQASAIAVERLQEACGYAGFAKATLFPEPLAAALSFLNSRPRAPEARSRVLAFDFGGGTLDLTLLESAGSEFEILATHGVALGGDEIDRRIYRHKVFPELGAGCRVPNALHTGLERFPFREFEERLLNWPLAYELNRPELRELIARGMREGGATGQRLGRLYRLVTRNQAYRVLRAIERAKLRLSSQTRATIEVPELELRLELTRAEFEAIIADPLGAVERAVRDTLELAAVPAESVDVVVRTGGSSQIPAVKALLERIFPARVVEHGIFTSIAAGLAIASFYGYDSPLRAAGPGSPAPA